MHIEWAVALSEDRAMPRIWPASVSTGAPSSSVIATHVVRCLPSAWHGVDGGGDGGAGGGGGDRGGGGEGGRKGGNEGGCEGGGSDGGGDEGAGGRWGDGLGHSEGEHVEANFHTAMSGL